MPNEVGAAQGMTVPSGPIRILSISGQIALRPDGALVGGDDAGQQACHCVGNIDALLRAAGATKTDVVKVVIFLTDMADHASVARAREE